MSSGVVGRTVALLLALLTTGSVVGAAIFHQSSAGDDWYRQATFCTSRYVVDPQSPWETANRQGQLLARCMDQATRPLVAYEVVGIVVALTITIAGTMLAPAWLVRRRGWRPLPASLEAARNAVSGLASERPGGRAPEVFLGPLSQRDAVTFGLPGRYRIVLPPALAVRPAAPEFVPVVRHELAHMAQHDVLIAWSSRPALWVCTLLLAAPLVSAVLDRDGSIVASYLWRAAVLLLVAVAVAASILRSREYQADAAAAASGSTARSAMLDVLDSIPARPGRRIASLLALHPTAAQRSAALRDPARREAVGVLDAFTVSCLTALALQVVDNLLADRASWSFVGSLAGPVLVGLLVGGSLGSGLWRSAVSAASVGRRPAAAPAVGGVVLGWTLGSLASLGQLVTAQFGVDLVALALTAALVGAAVALIAALATATTRGGASILAVQRRRVLILSVVLVALAAWWGDTLGLAVQTDPDRLGMALALLAFAPPLVAVLLLAAVLGARLIRAAPRRVPVRLLFVACLVPVPLVVMGSLIFRPSGTVELIRQEQIFVTSSFLTAAAGLIAAVILTVRAGASGLALALAVVPAAIAASNLALAVLNLARGADLDVLVMIARLGMGQGLGILAILVVAAGWAGCTAVRQVHVNRRPARRGPRLVHSDAP